MRAETFEPFRGHLMAVAYRMLGSVAGAEDVVQETWVRWASAEGVDAPRAWLTTVCTRLCLDELRSARARREEHVGPWLPEPWVDDGPPDDGPLGRSLSVAFLLLLEALNPRERAAFLLREVFDEDYAHIAEVLSATEPTVRQWVRRAKQAIDADRPRFDADPVAQEALLAAFGAACASGDLATLEALLTDDVIATGDGGGRAIAAPRPLPGPSAVARFLLGVLRKAPAGLATEVRWINGQPGLLLRLDGRVTGAITLGGRDGRVARYWYVSDPWKLARIR
ncbi:MAG: RNA polymerase sigma factor SigJ [Myxococcota bacterium]